MLFFNRKSSTHKHYNYFTDNPDVLRIARVLSKSAIEYLQSTLKFRTSTNNLEINLRINIQDTSYENYRCFQFNRYTPNTFLEISNGVFTHCCYSFSGSFGMESIHNYQWNDFMDALYAQFKTLFDAEFVKTFSHQNCSVNIFRSNYTKEDLDSNDSIIRFTYPAIEITFKKNMVVEKPMLKKW